MKRKRCTDERVAFALRQAESGTAVGEICRKMGVSEPTYYLYGLLPLRKRPSGWGVLASLRTCIRRLGSDPSARMANPHARASTDGRPTSGRDSSQALRASV